jgi:hypothetical protein
MSGSVGSSTSSTAAIDDTATLDSLTSPSIAMCEWQSMMPGMTKPPPASITRGPRRDVEVAAHRRDLSVAHQHLAARRSRRE